MQCSIALCSSTWWGTVLTCTFISRLPLIQTTPHSTLDRPDSIVDVIEKAVQQLCDTGASSHVYCAAVIYCETSREVRAAPGVTAVCSARSALAATARGPRPAQVSGLIRLLGSSKPGSSNRVTLRDFMFYFARYFFHLLTLLTSFELSDSSEV